MTKSSSGVTEPNHRRTGYKFHEGARHQNGIASGREARQNYPPLVHTVLLCSPAGDLGVLPPVSLNRTGAIHF